MSDVESVEMNPYLNITLPAGYYTTLLLRNVSHDVLAISNSFAIAFKAEAEAGTYFGFSCANKGTNTSKDLYMVKLNQSGYGHWEDNVYLQLSTPSVPIFSGKTSINIDNNGKLYTINCVTIKYYTLFVYVFNMFKTSINSVTVPKIYGNSYINGPSSTIILKLFNNYSILKTIDTITVISYDSNEWWQYSVYGYNNYSFYVGKNQVKTGSSTSTEGSIQYISMINYPYPDSRDWYHIGFIKIREVNSKAILLARIYNNQTNEIDYLIYVATISGTYGSSLTSDSSWACYYNIPSGITEIVGGDCWISSDSKWWFFVNRNHSNSIYYTKGLYYVRAADNSELFTETGFTNKSYVTSTNTDSAYQATKEYYILDVRFNSNSDKMMVLGNVSKGYFGDDTLTETTYIEGIQPDIIMCFILDKSKNQWRQLTHTNVGLSGLWNNYAASASSSGNTYKPFFNFINNETINFVYPGGTPPYTSYSYNLTWGD